MFPDRIRGTAFTDRDVESAFRITGDDVYDAVFKSTLRAVLPPRMGDDHLFIKYRDKEYTKSTADEANDMAIASAVYGSIPDEANTLTIINMSRMPELSRRVIDGFLEKYGGSWKRIERMTKFFESSFQIVCFVNEDIKSCILVIGRLDIMRLHYITCSLAAFLPWYFPKEKGLTSEERSLLMSLRKNRSQDWLEALSVFESKYDFYSLKLEALSGFESEWMHDALRESQNRCTEIKESIAAHQRDIDRYLRSLEEEATRSAGLAARINDEKDDELRDYFIDNKNRVRLVNRSGNSLTFEVTTVLTYWDEDMAETLYGNKHSYIYTSRGEHPRMKSDDFAKLFKSIFIDQKFKLRLCAQYRISTGDRTVYGVDRADYTSASVNFFPNTHIDSYSCLGAYRQTLNEMIACHNYLGIMEQCVVSAQSFNLNDTTVLEEFCKKLYSTNIKCILLPDGTEVTPVDAVKTFGEDAEDREDRDGEENSDES